MKKYRAVDVVSLFFVVYLCCLYCAYYVTEISAFSFSVEAEPPNIILDNSVKVFLIGQMVNQDGSFSSPVKLGLSDLRVSGDQEFFLDVMINSATDIFGLGFDLRFDPEILEFVRAKDMGFLSNGGMGAFMIAAVNPAGNLVFGITRLGAQNGGVSGSGLVARLYFRALKDGSSDISFSRNVLCQLEKNKKPSFRSGDWQGGKIISGDGNTKIIFLFHKLIGEELK